MINVNMTDKAGVTLATAGKYCADNVKVTPSAGILRKDEQAKTATPTTIAQDITPDAGKALSKVTVNPITAAIVGDLDADSFAPAIVAAIEGKGVTVPDGTLLDGMAALIESIEAGGGGGGGVSGNGEWASGTYTPSETKTIGISASAAIKIDTGLSDIRYFAIIRNSTISTYYAYEFIMAAWDYNNGDYYGFRLAHGSQSSISSISAGTTINNQYVGYTMFSDGGIMSISGITSSTKVTAGNTFTWFAIGR